MLRNSKDLEHYAIDATDGLIGHVRDFFFDDKAWVVRYLAVETGGWLTGREVLISPLSISHCDDIKKLLSASLTKAQVKGSPDIDTQQPISRQHEMDYLGYYGYPYYWDGSGLWGSGGFSNPRSASVGVLDERAELSQRSRMQEASADAGAVGQLRSINAVHNYRIEATDGEIGHVRSLLVEEGTWAIRYLVVETSHWWSGHQVLVVPEWIRAVSWLEQSVHVGVTRQQIKTAPAYDAALQLERTDEQALFKHYGHPGYWGQPL